MIPIYACFLATLVLNGFQCAPNELGLEGGSQLFEQESAEFTADTKQLLPKEHGQAAGEEAPSLTKWELYKRHYRKHYRSLGEQLFRFQQFVVSSARVAKQWFAYNNLHSTTFYFALNRFSDLTAGEKMKIFGIKSGQELPDQLHATAGNYDGSEPIPGPKMAQKFRKKRDLGLVLRNLFGGGKEKRIDLSVDWRRDCLTESVMDQGDCGCCYAMASLRMFEWLYCKAKGKSRKFSEQMVVDCGGEFGLEGCKQGNLFGVFNFLQTHGLFANESYPYLGTHQDTCPLEKQPSEHEIEGQQTLSGIVKVKDIKKEIFRQDDDAQRAKELASAGPQIAFVCLFEDFFDYAGGVYKSIALDKCDTGHFMLLVGHGHDKRAGRFWLFSNSFGPDWGETGGYVRVARDGGHPPISYTVKVQASFE